MAHTMTKLVGVRGDRLRAARERMAVTQADVARELGTKQQYYSRYESEQISPSAEVLRRLAEILEVSADYLLGLSDDTGDDAEDRALTPLERKLLWALRHGYIREALEAFAVLSEPEQGPTVPGE